MLLLLALSGVIPVYSQVMLKSEYQGEYYIISVESKPMGTYSIFLDISRADNYGGPVKRVVAVEGTNEVLRLKRENPAKNGWVTYRYWYTEGIADGRRDTNFVYRLPYSIHKNTVKVLYTYEVREKLGLGRTSPFPFIAMFFRTEERDTIYAARKGRVIRIEDEFDTSNTPELSFSTQVNRMVVLHDDGTVANYSGIERGGFLVREGDMVYPDMPVAIAGSFDGYRYGFYFNVGYPVLTGVDDRPWARRYYKPIFATSEGEKRLENNTVYIAKVDDGLITREMKGREKKKYEQSKAIAPAEK